MTWSYTDTLPTDKDTVRALVGDTDTTNQLVTDELITAYLPGGSLAEVTVRLAAASVAGAIAAKFARMANSLSAGGTAVNWGDRSKAFRDLADELRAADAAADADGLFDWAEQVPDVFSARERLTDQILRDAV